MKKYLKESVLLILIGVPYIYLALIWNELPNQVPTHFNINGTADDWSGKAILPFFAVRTWNFYLFVDVTASAF